MLTFYQDWYNLSSGQKMLKNQALTAYIRLWYVVILLIHGGIMNKVIAVVAAGFASVAFASVPPAPVKPEPKVEVKKPVDPKKEEPKKVEPPKAPEVKKDPAKK